MSSSSGNFVWYELMTTDPAAAERFYTRVVGWTAADAGMPGMKYTLLSAGGHQIAGMMALPPEAGGMPPCWTGYVAVDDVDAKAAEIATAGGSVLHLPDDIPGVGRFAVVADPQGASFCIFKGLMQAGEALPPQPSQEMPGAVGWHELNAGALDAAWGFYSRVFGWTRDQAIDMGPAGTYQLFAVRGQAKGGMMNKPPGMPVPNWQFYFNVEAIDAAVARVGAGGGKVINGPMEVPGGSWIVNAVDPQGAMFALVAPRR